MNVLRILLSCAVSAYLTTACAPHRPTLQKPTLESRRSGEWRQTADKVQAGQYTIYYHGKAQPALGAKRDHWVGHISGDIFVVGPKGYVMIPAGGLSVAADGALSASGIHYTIIDDQPSASQ